LLPAGPVSITTVRTNGRKTAMKTLASALIVSLFCGALSAQDMPKPQKEHEWLQQLVGEWESEAEITTEPGKPPMKNKGSEHVRAIGGFWILSETKGDIAGMPFTGILSLGYSLEKKKFVGTWIDSVTSHLWTYTGSMDAAAKALTLEAEGPGHDGKPTKFREVLTVKDKDHKTFTSSAEKDGQWMTFLKIEYTRKK
jgi:hypothetical protein